LLGNYVCGRRGGIAFKDVQRVDKAGRCPKDTRACSSKTKPGNTLCYPKNVTECPITEMNISRNSDKLKLNYSTDSDNLPIMTFKLEN